MLFDLPGARINYPGQGVAGIELPPRQAGPLPVVIAVHGSGRGAADYWQTPFYSRQRELALEHGCLFAVVSNGPDTWGLDDGLYNLRLLTEYVAANYPVADRFLFWATSAGGVLTHRMAAAYPQRVAAVLGTFPVYDLAREFRVLPNCGKAWGTQDETAFLRRIAGKNPPELAEQLENIPYFISHGDSDSAVPIADHSLYLAQQLGENVHLQVIPGGEHGAGDLRYLETMPQAALQFYRDLLIQPTSRTETNSKEAYLKDPCGVSSIPYWKTKHFPIPENMRVLHDREYDPERWRTYRDEPYFRLYHPLTEIPSEPLDNILVVSAQPSDIPLFVDIINRSYSDLSVTFAQLEGYTRTEVYCPELWVIAIDRRTSRAVGCGIADLDRDLREGILEWIQVIPSYRGQKIGQLIVSELLHRMAGIADFATVSGKVKNPSSPEKLYRKCGFVGKDIWHVLTE